MKRFPLMESSDPAKILLLSSLTIRESRALTVLTMQKATHAFGLAKCACFLLCEMVLEINRSGLLVPIVIAILFALLTDAWRFAGLTELHEDLPADFEQKRITYYQALDQPLDATTFVTRLRQQMHDALVMFNDNLPSNDKVRITARNGGWISLTPLDPQPDPPQLIEVKREIAGLWSMTSLLDILKETDLRVNFTNHFRGTGDREILSPSVLQKRFLLCLYGLGTNIGLKQVSSMTNMTGAGEKYTDLRYIYQRYLHRDSLREAIRAVVNNTFRIRDSSIWGEGTTAVASDAKKFAA